MKTPSAGKPRCVCSEIPLKNGAVLSPVCIGSLWLFENLDAREIAALAEAAVRRTYEEGESIFSQGDNVDRLFLVKAGLVKLSKVMEDGTEITLDMRKSGDFLGENMLGEDVEYPVSAICLEQTLICGFMKERFEHLVLSYPRIGLQVMKNLSKQISWLTHRVESMSLTGLEKRLYQTLLNIALEHGTKAGDGFIIRFPLTHEDLGFLVGAHRVSVTRAMKELRKAGTVVQQEKTLFLKIRET